MGGGGCRLHGGERECSESSERSTSFQNGLREGLSFGVWMHKKAPALHTAQLRVWGLVQAWWPCPASSAEGCGHSQARHTSLWSLPVLLSCRLED